ncbi:MAG: hypothetical protein U1E83_10285 [Methylotetracoccus sp.]
MPLYMQRAGFSAEDIDRQLNQASGLKGLCGTNDMREVLARAASGDQDAGLAVDLYCYRIKKYIGAYHAALGGADAVVFTGGVGENSPEIRERVCDGLEALGIRINCARNRGEIDESAQVGQAGSPVAVTVVRTNEELAIARQAYAVVCASGRLSAESAPEA